MSSPINNSSSSSTTGTTSIDTFTTVVINNEVTSSSQDSTSSAASSTTTVASTNADPTHPRLVASDQNITSAEMYALIAGTLSKARKEQIASNQQDDSKFALTINTTTSTLSPPSDLTTPVTGSNPSSSSTTPSSGNTTPTTATPITITTLAVNIDITTPLNNVIAEKLKRKFANLPPLKNHDANQVAINTYIQRIITGANTYGAAPAQNYLSLPGSHTALNLDPKAVHLAQAVSSSEYIMGLVNSGNISTFFEQNIYPNDLKAAKEAAGIMGSVLLETTLNQIASALKMPGYANQVLLQAQLVQNENALLTDPAKLKLISDQLTQTQSGLGGLTAAQSAIQLTESLKKVSSQAPFASHSALLTALDKQFQKDFSTHSSADNSSLALETANSLARGALTNPTLSFYNPPNFSSQNINLATVQSTIGNAIEQNFLDSDAAIRLSSKENEQLHAILVDIQSKDLASEQGVRQSIHDQLLKAFPNLTTNQANHIAAAADLGISQTGPLYQLNDTSLINPLAFADAIRTGYQATTHINPSSAFGQAIDHVSGLTTGHDTTSMIALLNQSYADSSENNHSYLNLTPQQQAESQTARFYEPGAQLVMEWGKVMHGGAENKKDQKTIDVPV